MAAISSMWQSLPHDKRGNISLLAALASPLIIYTLALGVDYGSLTMQQRKLQQTADLAAIVAASNVSDVENSLLLHFTANKQNYAIRTETGLLTQKGRMPFDSLRALSNYDGYAEVEMGQYTPSSSIPVDQRFKSGAKPYNAARVAMHEKGQLYFASSIATPPQLMAKGTAASPKFASFSIGSRLASLDGGIVNTILGSLLGTTVSLKAMDYRALVDADISAIGVIDQLALDLHVKAGTYSDLLKTRITYGQLIAAMAKNTTLTPGVTSILKTLETVANKSTVTLKLENALKLDPYAKRLLGTGDHLAATVGVYDLLSAAAVAGNGNNQVAVDLGATVPGLASLKVALAIGEPPVGTPSIALGDPGSIIRTAQTRLKIDFLVNGLSALAGMTVNVPLYLEVANAEAKLSAIQCYSGLRPNADVDVQAVPGVAELALGTVDPSAFINFGSAPRVTKAALINSSLLKINGMSHVTIGNLSAKTLHFTPSEIKAGEVKTISTENSLTSLTTSLLNNLDADINVLLLTLGTPKAVQAALASTLSKATTPLDTALYNVLLTLGIRIGEVDVRVPDAVCQRSALVQ